MASVHTTQVSVVGVGGDIHRAACSRVKRASIVAADAISVRTMGRVVRRRRGECLVGGCRIMLECVCLCAYFLVLPTTTVDQ